MKLDRNRMVKNSKKIGKNWKMNKSGSMRISKMFEKGTNFEAYIWFEKNGAVFQSINECVERQCSCGHFEQPDLKMKWENKVVIWRDSCCGHIPDWDTATTE